VKKIAKVIVRSNPEITSLADPENNAECAQVKDAPEVKRRVVFNKGISHGLIT
jgi:hypothetical protein